jgi:hypothetical protein
LTLSENDDAEITDRFFLQVKDRSKDAVGPSRLRFFGNLPSDRHAEWDFDLEIASNLGTGLMRYLFLRAILGGVALASCSALGQMHKVAKPEQVVRAIGVYEWTGDMAKPTASRLIPVSVFIEGKMEDASVYVARPVPFALLSGNVYELQAAGIDRGFLDLAYARHIQTADGAFEDGWFGYGSVKPLSATKKSVALRPSKTLPVLTTSKGASTNASGPHLETKTSDTTTATGTDPGKSTSKPDASAGTSSTSSNDSDKPTMKRRQGSEDTTVSSGSSTTDSSSTKNAGTTPADDPDRPTMKRRQDSDDTTASSGGTTTDSSSAKTTGSTPADDPDRPTMKRRQGSDDTTASSGSTTTDSSTKSAGTPPADDPDRPTLKRHSPEDAKKAKSGQNDVAMATGVGSLNEDPDRPNLHRGKPTSTMTETDLPKLVGLPQDLHQMVAVSDAANRDPHEFTRDWQDEAEHATVLQRMQEMARARLAAYRAAPAPPAPPAVKKTSTTRSHRTPPPPVATPEPLLDEELKAFTLSYGGAATYVYTAHTGGIGAKLRYITVVAQADGLGELKPAIQSVTDAAHLDSTPRMKFVDVVDAEASNRASLLFELRGQSARQFGLYRVIAARSEQIFLTGTTQ